MQYILTEEERANLVPLKELDNRKDALEIARKLILESAKFTCIHEELDYEDWSVCDECPCSPLKQENYKLGKLICPLRQEYSQ